MKQQIFNRKQAVTLLLMFLSSLMAISQAVAEPVYNLDLSASEVRKIVVAVPPFIDGATNQATKTGREVSSLLARALEFHGFIQIVDPARYQSNPTPDWAAIGTDYVVRGKITTNGGDLSIEGSLYDVIANKSLPGRRLKGAENQQKDMTLRLADGMIGEFTGTPGISRSKIAFISDQSGRKEVYLTDVLGQSVRQVTRHNHLCVSPRFTPDGRDLAYSSYHRGNQNLYITDLSQSKVTRALSRRNGMNLAPAFSPDNRTMVVTLSKNGSPDLFLMDRKGTILEQLTRRTGINVSPAFSPDGNSLAFVSDRSGRPQIYIMDMQSKQTRRLTLQGKENAEPSWSPKGDLIVYTSLESGHTQINTISVQGGNPARISSGYGDFESPTWSPDGRQISFSRKRNGHQEICAIYINSKKIRTLFTLKGNQSYPRWSPGVK